MDTDDPSDYDLFGYWNFILSEAQDKKKIKKKNCFDSCDIHLQISKLWMVNCEVLDALCFPQIVINVGLGGCKFNGHKLEVA